ncbi:unnamed protein product [Soboliphyme baturini]|uniref:Lipoxygenase domain-containing protein n=1 Tax=Soboliphyme baturini TaxID=241478 RepID=A0A183I9W4_9BILA|nr:unnamed protein product [Soboliphyme baturini]
MDMITTELSKLGYEMWRPALGGSGVLSHSYIPDVFKSNSGQEKFKEFDVFEKLVKVVIPHDMLQSFVGRIFSKLSQRAIAVIPLTPLYAVSRCCSNNGRILVRRTMFVFGVQRCHQSDSHPFLCKTTTSVIHGFQNNNNDNNTKNSVLEI